MSLHIVDLEAFYFLEVRIVHPFEIFSSLSEVIHIDNLISNVSISLLDILIFIWPVNSTSDFRGSALGELLLLYF